MLDTRYYLDGAESLIDEYKIDDILVLYNMNTVDKDTGVAGIY